MSQETMTPAVFEAPATSLPFTAMARGREVAFFIPALPYLRRPGESSSVVASQASLRMVEDPMKPVAAADRMRLKLVLEGLGVKAELDLGKLSQQLQASARERGALLACVSQAGDVVSAVQVPPLLPA